MSTPRLFLGLLAGPWLFPVSPCVSLKGGLPDSWELLRGWWGDPSQSSPGRVGPRVCTGVTQGWAAPCTAPVPPRLLRPPRCRAGCAGREWSPSPTGLSAHGPSTQPATGREIIPQGIWGLGETYPHAPALSWAPERFRVVDGLVRNLHAPQAACSGEGLCGGALQTQDVFCPGQGLGGNTRRWPATPAEADGSQWPGGKLGGLREAFEVSGEPVLGLSGLIWTRAKASGEEWRSADRSEGPC